MNSVEEICDEAAIINNSKKIMKGEKVSIDNSGLSKREWNELMEAFDLKDRLI